MNPFVAIHHASVLVADTAKALAFYEGILGLEPLPRPDLGYPGAWLGVGAHQIHLLELPNPDPVSGRPTHGGRDRRLALSTSDIATVRDRLAAAGVGYTESRSGRQALFCRDPDGNALEIVQIG